MDMQNLILPLLPALVMLVAFRFFFNSKIKLAPLFLTFVTIAGFQFFFRSKVDAIAQQDKPTSFEAPTSLQEAKVINTQISFAREALHDPVETTVKTRWGRLVFSSSGAVLKSFDYIRTIDGQMGEIPVFHADNEDGSFLVALTKDTPKNFSFEGLKEGENTFEVRYKAQGLFGVLRKTFVIFKQVCRIDLTISSEPAKGMAFEPRLFIPAPRYKGKSPELDTTNAIVINSANSCEKIVAGSLSDRQGWYEPQLAGAFDRYMVNAVVSDANRFVQRAYYKLENQKGLTTILEGPTIHEPQEWTMSFYCGPKMTSEMSLVDSRLEKIRDTWWPLSLVSKAVWLLFKTVHDHTRNYGLAIILLALCVQLLGLPFAFSSDTDEKRQAELSKKMAYIKQRYKNDPQMLLQEQTALMRKYGLGMGRFIPQLIQMPIMLAFMRMIPNAVELYKAPLWWIADLSSSDPYYILPLCFALCSMMNVLMVPMSSVGARLFSIAVSLMIATATVYFSAGVTLYLATRIAFEVIQRLVVRYISSAKKSFGLASAKGA